MWTQIRLLLAKKSIHVLGECRLISRLPGKASRTLVESRDLSSNSSCVLEAEPGKPDITLMQPKRVKFTNCSQFLSHTLFGLDFHFSINFLLIGIGQLDNDV